MNKKMKETMDKKSKAKPKGMAKGGYAKGATKSMCKAPAKKGKK